MSVWRQHKVIERMIFDEAARLSFDQQMIDDLSKIMFQREQRKLTLSQAKSLLVELQTLETNGESLRPDSPLAKWQARQKA